LRQTLAIAYHRRGTAYASKKQYDQAIADYTKALEIDPKYISAYNDRGLAYMSKGNYERAIADVTRAVELAAEPTSRPTTVAATPPAGITAKSEPSLSGA
jgi:tetratricopeptide (TPR) repeat protein